MTETINRSLIPRGIGGVSVVIPAYNSARFVSRALDSALRQDWEDLEIVVVDDGSTDETPRVLRGYAEQYPAKIHIISQRNMGISCARNAGILASRQRFVALLDHDDEWEPTKLRRQMSTLLASPALEFCFTGVANRRAGSDELTVECWGDWDDLPDRILARLLVRNCICTSSVVATRRVFVDLGLFDPAFPAAQDYDMWLRVAAAGYRMAYVPEPLTVYFRHGANTSYDSRAVGKDTERALRKLFRAGGLPAPVSARGRWYRAHRYLNNACIHLENRDYAASLGALVRAFATRPLSARPGWLLVLAKALAGAVRRID